MRRRLSILLGGLCGIGFLITSAGIADAAKSSSGSNSNQNQSQNSSSSSSSQSQSSSSLNPSISGTSFDFSRPDLRQQWRSHPPNLEKAARFVCYDVKEDVSQSYPSDPTGLVPDPITGKLYAPDVPLYAVPSNKIFTDQGHVIECLDRKVAYRSPLKMGDRLVVVLNINNNLLPKLTRVAINVQSQSVAPIIINPLRSAIDAGTAPNAEEQGSFDTSPFTHDPNSLAELEARIAQARRQMAAINANIQALQPQLKDEITTLQNEVSAIKNDASVVTHDKAQSDQFTQQVEELNQALARIGQPSTSAEIAAHARYDALVDQLHALQQSYAKQESEAKVLQQQAYVHGDQEEVERQATAIGNYAGQAAAINKPLGIASELIPSDSHHYYFEIGSRLSGDTIPTLTIMAEYKQPDFPVTDSNHQIQCIETHMTPVAGTSTTGPTPPNPPGGATPTPSAPGSSSAPTVPYQTSVVPCLPYSSGGTNPAVYNSKGAFPVTYPQVAAVGLVQETLPQVHSLSSFNVDAGVVYNTTKTRSFGFDKMTGNGITTGGTPIVDPVLFLTWYPRAIDAEGPTNCYKGDLTQCASELGLTLGLSMAAPTSNFYVGTAIEPYRGVQIVGGVSISDVATLAPSNTAGATCAAPCTSAGSPPTVQKFKPGGYIGLSFDIKSFVQSISGAAFGPASAGSSGSSGSGKGGGS